MIKQFLSLSGPIGRAVAISVLVSSCGEQKPTATAPNAIPVKLQTLEKGTLISSNDYVGTLEARQRVSVAPRVNGRIRAIFVKEGDTVRAGQKIAELDPDQQQEQVNAAIGQVDSAKANLGTSEAEYRRTQSQADADTARIAQSRADVLNAQATVKTRLADVSAREADLQRTRADLDLAQKNYERAGFLVTEGAQAQQDLDNQFRAIRTARANVDAQTKNRDAARQQVEAARANTQASKEALNIAIKNQSASRQQIAAAQSTVNSRKAAVSSAQGQLGATRQDLVFNSILAPIDGIVGDFNERKVGDFISAGQVVTTLTDNQILDLNVQIPVELQSRLRTGLPVEIINKDGTAGQRGQVTFISSTVSQATQSVLVKFSFTNDGSLRDRQYTRVRVIWDQKPGVLIPTIAITSVGAQKFVFVAEKEKPKEGQESQEARLVVKQKPIQVGTIQGQAYQVISGVRVGDKIAVSRILDLRNGTAIKVSEQ